MASGGIPAIDIAARKNKRLNLYSIAAAGVLGLHRVGDFVALVTRRRSLLRWLHLGSLVWGVLVEILPWTCPLTPAENWLRTRAGAGSYQGGLLLYYLDSLVYPDIPPTLRHLPATR